MAELIGKDPTPALSTRVLWGIYIACVLGVGTFQALAEVQDYLREGGTHPWEPFVWELSSTISSGLLALIVYRWHARLLAPTVPSSLRWLGHIGGALVFSLLHVTMMLSLRWLVYQLAGLPYRPGALHEVLAYEVAKDVVTYLLIVIICHALRVFLLDQQRQRELAQVRSELAEARLTRLAEQIQPHFLFNTLNMVSSVMYEDLARADKILTDLADLLRQTLNANQLPLHSLADELRIIEPFLALMRERFGARLQVSIDITPEALRCAVPSLVLMAPVENAVKHGVEHSLGPVAVTLHAQRLGDELVLRVEDTAGVPTRDHRPGGIGLTNTRERLATLFGEAASVTLTARSGGGACLTLRLPAREIA